MCLCVCVCSSRDISLRCPINGFLAAIVQHYQGYSGSIYIESLTRECHVTTVLRRLHIAMSFDLLDTRWQCRTLISADGSVLQSTSFQLPQQKSLITDMTAASVGLDNRLSSWQASQTHLHLLSVSCLM